MKILVAAALMLALTGCIGTNSNVRSAYTPSGADKFSYTVENSGGMSAEGLDILNTQLRADLGPLLAASTEPGAKRVQIRITNYYMRHGAARALVGIMAGKDNITSVVTVLDAGTDTVLGTTEVVSSNATAFGTSSGLIEGHAKEISAFLKGTAK